MSGSFAILFVAAYAVVVYTVLFVVIAAAEGWREALTIILQGIVFTALLYGAAQLAHLGLSHLGVR